MVEVLLILSLMTTPQKDKRNEKASEGRRE